MSAALSLIFHESSIVSLYLSIQISSYCRFDLISRDKHLLLSCCETVLPSQSSNSAANHIFIAFADDNCSTKGVVTASRIFNDCAALTVPPNLRFCHSLALANRVATL